MDETKRTDDALFESLQKAKKKKRRTRLIRTLVILAVVGALLIAGVRSLRKRVDAFLAESGANVKTYAADYGSVNTQVTGSGTLQDLDSEELTLPAGVEIDRVLVRESASVTRGELLASVDMATVTSTLSDIQSQIEAKDKSLSAITARGKAVINAGVAGRVKLLYAQSGDDVAACMVENGALAVISQDGWLSLTIPGEIGADTALRVARADGSTLSARVESSLQGSTTVLVSDRDCMPDETVTVLTEAGEELGSGPLAIHSPIRVVGYTGTVSAVSVRLNQTVYPASRLFVLDSAESSAEYDLLLKERADLEKTLLALLQLYRDGGLSAPFDGTVLSIAYGSAESASPAASAAAAFTGAQTAAGSGNEETKVLTLSRDEKMTVRINVSEMDILALAVGQSATLSVDSIGKDSYDGTVTEIVRIPAADGKSGGSYAATVTLDKAPLMLGGMTADVAVTITGTEHVLRVPTAAVNRTSVSAYVYSGYDEATGQLTDPVTVSVGAANKDFTEIREGLEEGTTVYYFENRSDFGSMDAMYMD